MSNVIETQVTGGGTRCFGAEVPIACLKDRSRKFAIVPNVEQCTDGKKYDYKTVVFDHGKAISVMCITAKAAAVLRGQDLECVKDVTAPQGAIVADIITCPPGVKPDAGGSPESGNSLTVAEKFEKLTDWGEQLFGPLASALAAGTSSAA